MKLDTYFFAPEHLKVLEQGVKAWNAWRARNPKIKPGLSDTVLFRKDLRKINLRNASLARARLSTSNLRGADLRNADLRGAPLVRTNLSEADLTGANLMRAVLVGTNLRRANLTGCTIFGVSAWDVNLEGAIQQNLRFRPGQVGSIHVDNLEVAQFIYLLLNNEKLHDVIDTITSKVVLILGRFTPARLEVLEAIREKLRDQGRLPLLFNFQRPETQTADETISTLAHMARFVIADLTDAKSVLQELRAIVPNSPSVVVQPLLLASQEEPGMFDFFRKFPWVLKPIRYTDQKALIAKFDKTVIAPAEAKALAAGT